MEELILKIIEERRFDILAKLRKDHAGNYKAYDFVMNYVRNYGDLPPVSVFKERFPTVVADAPIEYYYDSYQREVLSRDLFKLDVAYINGCISRGEPEKALEYLRRFVSEVDSKHRIVDIADIDTLKIELDRYIEETITGRRKGITTGWMTLDNATGGCFPGDLYLVVGRVKTGKTMILLYMMASAHIAGNSVMFVSMEMSLLQVAKRMFSLYSGINGEVMRTGHLSDFAREVINRTYMRMKELPPIHVIDGSMVLSLSALSATISQCKPDIVYIDGGYLLRVPTRGRSVWESAKEVADELKRMAMTHNIPIVASFQLNREVTKLKNAEKVGLEHIHLTDALSANCSWAIGVFDDPSESEEIKFIRILGTREGTAEDFAVRFDWETMTFEEVGRDEGRDSEDVTY